MKNIFVRDMCLMSKGFDIVFCCLCIVLGNYLLFFDEQIKGKKELYILFRDMEGNNSFNVFICFLIIVEYRNINFIFFYFK